MGQRLTLDSHIVGYWGFDEALETDKALDETSNALHLTVTSSNGTTPGRVGNARKFDGAASFASLSSSLLRKTGAVTLMAWVRLNTYNATGSQLRSIISCGGPTSGDNQLYNISVSLSGALVYKHDSASGPVVITTDPSTIRTNQLYFITVTRGANGGNQDVFIFVDNVQKTPASITVNGIPQTLPVPAPASNASAIFSVGRSQKESDAAFWDGFIDETSVHDIARPYHAYVIDSFYRGALRSATTKLSATNSVVAVSTYEMGAGVRWWCYERDRDLYVVKESPFGSFGPETQLVTTGNFANSYASTPELIYDAAVDILYVFFVAGNRIYKLTANSTDDPASINMPLTADTGLIIKSVDNADGGRIGNTSGGLRDVQTDSDFTYVNRNPIKFSGTDPDTNNLGNVGGGQQEASYLSGTITGAPNEPQVTFITIPTLGFGVMVGSVNPDEVGGYVVYSSMGGAVTQLATPVLLPEGTYFTAVSPRVYGQGYFAEALNVSGSKTGQFSGTIVDRFFESRLLSGGAIWRIGYDGDGIDREGATIGNTGGGQREVLAPDDFAYVNRTAVKISGSDPDINNLANAGGGQLGSITNGSTNRSVDAGKAVITG